MNLTRLEGLPSILTCVGCNRDGIGGTEAYTSASTGEERQPEDWYQKECGEIYCGQCAAKLMEEDPTRSRSQFYTDTAGTQIVYDHES
jgi:hypothetical protein